MIVFKQAITNITTDLANTYADYNPSTAYNSGDKVTDDGFYWELIPTTATGKKPSENPLYWEKIGVANKESIIDLRATTFSSKDGGFYIEFPLEYNYTYLAIGYYTATGLKIEALNDDDNVVKTYYDEVTSINQTVFDYYDYIYEPYSIEVDRVIFFKLYNIGKKLKVSFGGDISLANTRCGFVLCGEGINMGETQSTVNFRFNSYSVKKTDNFGIMTIDKRAVQNLVDFTTIIERDQFMQKQRKIKELYDEFLCFILDEKTPDSSGMIGIGSIENCSLVYDEFDKSVVAYSVIEAI
jgi:hypothetical protein